MQTIYKLAVTLGIIIQSVLGFAQTKADRVYEMFENKDGVTSLSFTKSVLEPFEIFIDEDTRKVIYQMERIRFFSYNERKGNLESEEVLDKIKKEFKGGGYFEIGPEDLDCDDCDLDSDEVKMFGHGKMKNMDEFHFILEEDHLCLMFSFYGDITVEDLKEFSNFSNSTKTMISL